MIFSYSTVLSLAALYPSLFTVFWYTVLVYINTVHVLYCTSTGTARGRVLYLLTVLVVVALLYRGAAGSGPAQAGRQAQPAVLRCSY